MRAWPMYSLPKRSASSILSTSVSLRERTLMLSVSFQLGFRELRTTFDFAFRSPSVNSQKASVVPSMSMLGRLVARRSRMISSPTYSDIALAVSASWPLAAAAMTGRTPSPEGLNDPISYLARMKLSSSAGVHFAWSGLTPAGSVASSSAFTFALPSERMWRICACVHESIWSESTLVTCAPSFRWIPEHRMQNVTPRLVDAHVGVHGNLRTLEVVQSAHTSLPAMRSTRRSTASPM
mmetsp:Transcript_19129/g.49001  ORF Transcript_19129/g.49001 Transcript_19129/m.49001 type:complete len:237 (-) Transcript_19129:57-767(-)